MKKIAITGSTGLIGTRIIELLGNDFEFVEILQSKIDITDKTQTVNFIKNLDFDLLLHLAGFTNVDAAENNKDLARKVNVEGTRNVFEGTVEKNKQFIYISTDFVFDGNNPPYFENNTPHPLSFYAQTKFEGEQIVNGSGMIVRLSYPYRKSFEPKRDLVRNIKFSLEQGRTLQMVTDGLITPTYIDDIAYALKHLFNNYSPEIFHIVGANSLSPYDIGKLIAQAFHLNETLIQAATFQEYYANKAPRPQFSEIKSTKNNFYPMKTFDEGLKNIL